MPINNLVMKKLVIMKQVFNHGRDHSTKKTPLGNMLAIHHFDFAVEMLLKIIATKLQVGISGDYKFNELWGNVNSKYQDKYNKKLLLEGQMKNLHALRNSVQHSARVPSNSDVHDFEGYTHTFLNLTIQTAFAITLNDIRLSKLIADSELFDYVDNGKKFIESGKYEDAIAKLSLAFFKGTEKAIEKFGNMFSVESITWGFQNIQKLGPAYKREIVDAFERVEKNLYLLALDVDLEDYKNFVKTSYFVYWKGIGKSRTPSVNRTGDKKTKEQAEFCYRFVVDSLIALEL